MSTSPYRWIVVVAVTLVALVATSGCEQDPLRIPHLPDGGDLDAAEDAFLPDAIVRDAEIIPDVRPDLSYDACIAQIEVCNGVDDNCNDQVDEGFDKLNDARFCESCKGCKELLTNNAIPGCQAGKCTISSCKAGYVDANGDLADGCEYKCTPSGVEVCDGIDNDCNNQIDEGVQLTQQICKNLGPCAGATAECKGKDGWVCKYSADVELQPCTKDADCGAGNKCSGNVCPNLVIVDEKLCDGQDGDCDGLADDPWANPALPEPLGAECVPVPTGTCTKDSDCDPAAGSTCNTSTSTCTQKKGICKDVGKIACTANKLGSACKQTQTGVAPATEVCNGKDDDCDGAVDNNVTDEQWVNIGGVQIFKYEASRPDASAATAGILSSGRPCSVPGKVPWASVSRQQAQAACALAGGARLCTVSEWIKACRGQANFTYPYGNSFDPAKCNGRAFDTTQDKVLPTDQPATCVSDWGTAGKVVNLSGNLKEWVKVSGNSYELKGGAYDTPSIPGAGGGLSCGYQLPAPTTTLRLPTLGFRCCK